MLFQMKHFIFLTIATAATLVTVAAAPPKIKPVHVSTRNITRIVKGQIDVPVSTRYITTQETKLDEKQSKRFITTLCEEFKGHSVTATVILRSNPTWNPNKGVVYYYIVDEPNKTEKQSLCSNTKQGTVPAHATCIIDSFPSESNTLYLMSRTGTHDASFSINIEITDKASTKDNLKEMKPGKTNITSNYNVPVLNNVADEYLTEVITLENSQVIDLEDTALLSVTFCPRPQTNKYNIDSTVTAANGGSSFTHYICNKLPCEVDGPNVIAENKEQVPKNEVILGPETSGNLQLYVLVVCWAGIPDPDVPSGIAGEFLYTGEIIPIQ